MAEPEPERYRAVSLLAVAGLAVSCLWSAFLTISALSAWRSGSPLLFDAWTLIFPVLGVALSGVARFRIKQSEGTLTGTALTGWGIFLSIVSALSYWAYVAAVTLAIRPESQTFATQWFDQLKTGNLDAGFYLTVEPAKRRKPDPTLHVTLEKLNQEDTVRERSPLSSPLARFRRDGLVRVVEQGGAETQIQPLGVVDWEYRSKAYNVLQEFHITTPEGSGKAFVLVKTSEIDPARGRRWYVSSYDSGLQRNWTLTPLGERLKALRLDSRAYLDLWRINTGALPRSYFPAQLVLSTGPPMTTMLWCTEDSWARRMGDAPAENSLAIDDKGFWSLDYLRNDLLEESRNLLQHPARELQLRLEIPPDPSFARWRKTGESLQIEHDFRLRLPPRSGADKSKGIREMFVEGVFIVESDGNVLSGPANPKWRLAGVRLERGREGPPMEE